MKHCGPMTEPAPMRAPAITTDSGPMLTSLPISAVGSITAVGWMPVPNPCPRSIIRVSPDMAKRGRAGTIAASSPSACQSAPCHSTAARAAPCDRLSAYLAEVAIAS